VRIFVVYRPFRFFLSIGLVLSGLGTLLGLRFLWFYFTASGSGHVQSLILASILLGMGFQTITVAFLADLISVNRRLAEDNCYRLRQAKAAAEQQVARPHHRRTGRAPRRTRGFPKRSN